MDAPAGMAGPWILPRREVPLLSDMVISYSIWSMVDPMPRYRGLITGMIDAPWRPNYSIVGTRLWMKLSQVFRRKGNSRGRVTKQWKRLARAWYRIDKAQRARITWHKWEY